MRSWRHNSLYNPLNLTRWAPPLHFQDKDDDGSWLVLKKTKDNFEVFCERVNFVKCQVLFPSTSPPVAAHFLKTNWNKIFIRRLNLNETKSRVWCMICHLALALGKEESKQANMCVLIFFHNLQNVTLCDHQPVPIKLERGGTPGHGQNISLDLAY